MEWKLEFILQVLYLTINIIKAEHTIAGESYKMEIQVVHEAIEGTFKN